MAIGLYGGAFDPPHDGHVALARAAKRRFELPRLVVLVSEHPAHKDVELGADVRVELARAAFPDDDVRLDPHPRTIDLLRAERFDDPIFLVGADQFVAFPTWKEPDAVLELTRLGVATRPGFDTGRLPFAHSDRVVFFDIAPNPAASRDVRALAAAGEPLDGLVPPGVARFIADRRLYRND